MDGLNKLRKEINDADATILKALAKRRNVAQRVIEEKADQERPIRDQKREEELLADRIRMGRELGLDAHYITRIFHEIIDDSVRLQQLHLLRGQPGDDSSVKKVGFQGIEGAYSHLASQKFFAREKVSPSYHGYPTFAEVVRAVENGDVDHALLPVENTTAGSINEVYDLLTEADVSIIGEEIFPVEHCLLAIEKVPPTKIRRVLSHPQALAQCAKFLSTLEKCHREAFADTAMAVRKVKEDNDLSQAAIASEDAGRQYGLHVIKRQIADQRDNYTRFLVASKNAQQVDLRIPCKTSLVLATQHKEGALLQALSLLHEHKINLTKLESRPRPSEPFEYLFYLDFEGNLADENVDRAVKRLRGVAAFLKILGSYPMELRGRTEPLLKAVIPAATKTSTEPATGAASDSAKAATGAGSASAKPAARPIARDTELVTREHKPENTVINVRGVQIGAGELVVFAGPRVVESREQILACARQVTECGAKILQGGCFNPPTEPDTYGALGKAGLDALYEAGRHYGVPVICEAHSTSDIAAIADKVDLVQIGSRNMQDYALLREAGRINLPVLLKRGMMATLDDLLRAANYILNQGNHQVIVCERGVRTFESGSTSCLDLAAILSLHEMTHLPVAIDPAPAAAQSELVAPIALAACEVDPDVVVLEIHPDLANASISNQRALNFGEFSNLMGKLYGKRS